MSLIKKIDVEKHFAARRAMRQAAARPVSQPNATGFIEAEPAGAKTNAQGFIKDFSLEHSSSSVPFTPIA